MAKGERYILKSIPGGPADARDHAWLAYDQVSQRNVDGPMRRAKAVTTTERLNAEGERPTCDVTLTVVPGTEFELSARGGVVQPSVHIQVPPGSRKRTAMAVAYQVAARIEALSPPGARWDVRVEPACAHGATVLLLLSANDEAHYDAHAVLRDSVGGVAR